MGESTSDFLVYQINPYVVTRPLGASVADWLGKPNLGGLGLGDANVAPVLTLLIVLFVGYLTVIRVDMKDQGQDRASARS